MPKIKQPTQHVDYTPPLNQRGPVKSPTDEKSNSSARRAFSAPNTPRTSNPPSTFSPVLRDRVEEIVLPVRTQIEIFDPNALGIGQAGINGSIQTHGSRPPSPRESDSPPPGECHQASAFGSEALNRALSRVCSPLLQTVEPLQGGEESVDSTRASRSGSPSNESDGENLVFTGYGRGPSPLIVGTSGNPRPHRRHQQLGVDDEKVATSRGDNSREEVEEKQQVRAKTEPSIDRAQSDALVSACKENQKNYKSVGNKLVIVAQLVATVFAAIYLCPVGGALGYGLGTLAGFMGLFSIIEGKHIRSLTQLSALTVVLQREMINKSIFASFAPGFSSAVMIDGFGNIAKEALKTPFYKEVIQALKTKEFIAYLARDSSSSPQSLTINQVFTEYRNFKWLKELQDNRVLERIAEEAPINLQSQSTCNRFQKGIITSFCEKKANKPNEALLKGSFKVAAAACLAFSVGGGATVLATIGAGYVALDVSRRIYSKLKGDPYKNAAEALEGTFAKYVQLQISNGHSIEFIKRNIVQLHNIYKQQYENS